MALPVTQTYFQKGLGLKAEVLAGVARDHQVLLTELRRSETDGLEQLFFSLTAVKAAPAQEAAA